MLWENVMYLLEWSAAVQRSSVGQDHSSCGFAHQLCDWYIQTSGVRGYLDSARPRARRQVVVVATASQQPHPACEAVDEVSDEVTSA